MWFLVHMGRFYLRTYSDLLFRMAVTLTARIKLMQKAHCHVFCMDRKVSMKPKTAVLMLQQMFMSLYLHRLKDLRPVWARLTALTVKDVSEQTGNGGKRTPAPYVNAEYVNLLNQNALPTVYTPHWHIHTALNPPVFHTLGSWSHFHVSHWGQDIYQILFCDQSAPVSLCLALFLCFTSWHQPAPGTSVSPQCFCAWATSGPFILYLWHDFNPTAWQRRWQLHAKPGLLWSFSVPPLYPLLPSLSLKSFFFPQQIW